jgi:hypothetical protein
VVVFGCFGIVAEFEETRADKRCQRSTLVIIKVSILHQMPR